MVVEQQIASASGQVFTRAVRIGAPRAVFGGHLPSGAQTPDGTFNAAQSSMSKTIYL